MINTNEQLHLILQLTLSLLFLGTILTYLDVFVNNNTIYNVILCSLIY